MGTEGGEGGDDEWLKDPWVKGFLEEYETAKTHEQYRVALEDVVTKLETMIKPEGFNKKFVMRLLDRARDLRDGYFHSAATIPLGDRLLIRLSQIETEVVT